MATIRTSQGDTLVGAKRRMERRELSFHSMAAAATAVKHSSAASDIPSSS